MRARLKLVVSIGLAGGLTLCLGAGSASAQLLESADLGSAAERAGGRALADCLDGADCATPGASSGGIAREKLERRGLVKAQPTPAERSGTGGNRARSRGIIVRNDGKVDAKGGAKGGAKVAEAKPLPSVDVDIPFAFDSDRPLASARGRIRELAFALADARFRGATFVLVGHTDAKGSAGYNWSAP